MYAAHWRDVNLSAWEPRWPNFTPQEIACRGTGEIDIDDRAMDALQALRNEVGPLIINSAYRSPEHNRKVGGAKNSRHVAGTAFDIAIGSYNPVELEEAAEAHGFNGIGRYPDRGFIHIDMRQSPASWGKPWPVIEEDAYAPEPKRPVDPGAISAAATSIGGAAVVAAQQAQAVSDAIGLDISPVWLGVGAAAILAAGGLLWWYRNRRRDGEPE